MICLHDRIGTEKDIDSMQKVERRRHPNRGPGRRTGLFLCVFLLAGCVAAGLLFRKEADSVMPIGESRPVTGPLVQRKEEELKSITLAQRGKDPWTVVRGEDGGLRLLEEETGTVSSWTVDENIAEMLVDTAVNLTYDNLFAEKREDWEPAAEAFGLKDPEVTAVFRYTDGTDLTVRFGRSADPEGNTAYYMSVDGDERLFAASAGVMEDMKTGAELLHPVPRLEILSALLDRITVRNADGSVRTEWKLQGKITDRDAAENWLLTAPSVYPMDCDAMKNLLETAASFRLGLYIGEAGGENLKQYGLEEPSAILEFHTAAGSTGTVSDLGVYDIRDWEENTVTLTVGSRNEMTSYIRFGDEIYRNTNFSMSAFLEGDPLKSVARYLVITPLTSLESVRVERQGEEPDEYVLTPVYPDTEEGEETEETTYRCEKNGVEISYDAFSSAWERLLTVTVSGRLPEDFRPGEAHTKYTFRTVSGGTHTVELSDYDGMHDAVTLDGYTRFYLIKGGMTGLP